MDELKCNGEDSIEIASLQDLVTSFKTSIATSDWLKENTSSKWIAENPELAEEYLKAFNSSNSTPEPEEELTAENVEEFSLTKVEDLDGDLMESLGLLKKHIESSNWLTENTNDMPTEKVDNSNSTDHVVMDESTD